MYIHPERVAWHVGFFRRKTLNRIVSVGVLPQKSAPTLSKSGVCADEANIGVDAAYLCSLDLLCRELGHMGHCQLWYVPDDQYGRQRFRKGECTSPGRVRGPTLCYAVKHASQ